MNYDVSSALYFKLLSEEETRDLFDLMLPMLEYSISQITDLKKPLNSTKLQENLQNSFGFEVVPISVINKLLKRLKNKKVLYRENHKFYVCKKIDNKSARDYFNDKSNDFNNKMQTVADNVEIILNALADHLGKDVIKHREEIEKHLYEIIEKETANVISDDPLQLLYKESNKLNKKSSILNKDIGLFIFNLKDNDSHLYNQFLEIVEGVMLKKVIYLQGENNDVQESAFKNLDVYLDTTVLLKSLELKTEEDNRETKLLLESLNKFKVKIYCFEHNVDEVKNILTYYGRNLERVKYQTLETLDAKNYTFDDVQMYLDEIENKLTQKSIKIVPTPEHTKSNMKYDHDKLENSIYKMHQNDNGDGIDNDSRGIKDVNSISAIKRLRSEIQPIKLQRLETAGAIFVTNNKRLTEIAKNNKTPNSNVLSDVITESDLIALLWLKTDKTDKNFADAKLMQAARSAVNPAPIYLKSLLNEIENFEQKELIVHGLLSKYISENYAPVELYDKLLDKPILDFVEAEYRKITSLEESLYRERMEKNQLIDKINKEDQKKSKDKKELADKKAKVATRVIMVILAIVIISILFTFNFIFELNINNYVRIIIGFLLSLFALAQFFFEKSNIKNLYQKIYLFCFKKYFKEDS